MNQNGITHFPLHNHVTRDIKSLGSGCPACDEYWERYLKRVGEFAKWAKTNGPTKGD